MKFNKIFKRAAAVFMAAVTALSVIPATTAFNLDEKDPSAIDVEPEQSEEQPARNCANRER